MTRSPARAPARSVTDRPARQLRGLARGGALNLVGAGYAALVGFATATLVARGLPRAEAGVFFTATGLFVVVAVVAKLGTPTGLVYWVSRLRTRGRPELVPVCLAVALRPVAWVSFGLAVTGYLNAARLADLLGEGDSFATQVRLLAVLLPLAALTDAVLAATRGHRTMRPTVLVDRFGRSTLQLLGLLAAFALAAATSGYTLAWAAPWAVALLAAARYLYRLQPRTPHLAPHSGGCARGLSSFRAVSPPETTKSRQTPSAYGSERGLGWGFWGFTWPRGVANVVQLALRRGDIVLVAALAGLPAAAGYAVATRFTLLGQLGNTAIGSAAEPRLAEAMARHDRPAALRLYQTATGWLVLTVWPVYLLTASFAPLYLGLFGPGYVTGHALAVVWLLCGAMLVASGCGTVDVVLAMTGRTTWNLANVTAALAVNATLNLLLLPRIGIVGAGIAWAAATLVKNLLPLVQLARHQGLHPFGRGTLLAAGLAAGCFGVPPLLARLLLGPQPAALLAAVAAGLLCYLAGLWRLREPLRLSALRPGGIT